jgi:protein-S-isoprenylcysteine O-methyltransferase Ste14
MEITAMSALGAVTFSTALLVCAYLFQLIATDPNIKVSEASAKAQADGSSGVKKDRIRLLATSSVTGLARLVFTIPALYHVLLVLLFDFRDGSLDSAPEQPYCRHPENLDSQYFYWNWRSTIYIAATVTGALLRLKAFRDLGQNFSFILSRPKTLVTTGLYAYVQHPSYTAGAIAAWGYTFLTFGWHGPTSCLMNQRFRDIYEPWRSVQFAIIVTLGCTALVMRVRDEEAVLKAAFGEEWERWRQKRKRFIPWLI